MFFFDKFNGSDGPMNNNGMQQNLYEQVSEAWDSVNADLSEFNNQIPPLNWAGPFIDAAFYASFITEEGRTQRFRTVLIERHEKHAWRNRSRAARVRFTDPKDLTARNLAKCAAIHDSTNSIIVVTAESELSITELAIVPQVDRITGLEGIELPDALTLSVMKPGTMTMSRGTNILGRFSEGEFVPATSRPLHSRGLGAHIIPIVREHAGYREIESPYWLLYRRSLRYLLAKTAQSGRGALIVWCPHNARERVGQLLEHKHKLLARHEIPQQILSCAKAERTIRRTTKLEERRDLISKIDCLAALCGIDGALWLDDQFRPMSAGALIRAREWKGEVKAGPVYGAARDRVDIEQLGTRHRAAINLAGACAGTIVFAISGDGVVRAATNVEGTVNVWMDVLASNTLES